MFELYQDQDFTGIRVDADSKIVEIARPAGVVFALTPSTNPVATVFYKIMLCLLTRNAIIISPHPMAKACCADAARLLAKAAEEAGAPDGVIQVIDEPSLPIVETVMKSDRIDVILATGGTPVVRAAYSSGNPAIGVGPGNVPAYVDESADVAHAAKAIADSKAFDNGILCTNESAHHRAWRDRRSARAGAQAQWLSHVCATRSATRSRTCSFPEGKFERRADRQVGRDHRRQRPACGFRRARACSSCRSTRIGDDYPLSREKLCPVLGFYVAATRDAAMIACRAMTRRQGAGHSAAIHAERSRHHPALRRRDECAAHLGQCRQQPRRLGLRDASRADHDDRHRLFRPQLSLRECRAAASGAMGEARLEQGQCSSMPSFDGIERLEKPRIGVPPKGEIDYDFGNPPPGVASADRRRGERIGKADDIRAEIRRIILEELSGMAGALMAKLRSYIFIDQLQPETCAIWARSAAVSCRAPTWRRW